MSDLDLMVRDAFERRVPLRFDRRPAWDDVLARAGETVVTDRARIGHRSLRRPRRFLVALALFLLAAIVAGSALAALGQSPFGGLTSWFGAGPGKPAPPTEQAGFAARSDASYASFPKNTQLRLLAHASFRGQPYSLLGFRDGTALCLRLARADRPSSQGVNQCVPLRELRRSAAPALVASTAHLGIGKRAVDAIFGFADDTVRNIRVRHFRGDHQDVLVAGNAFLALHAATTNASYDPIVSIRTRARDGRYVTVPFAPALGVRAPHGVPSYIGRRRVRLGGPAKAVAASHTSAISWLAGRKPRGHGFALDPRFVAFLDGSVIFSRSVQPDPGDPFRMGVSLVRVGPHSQDAVVTLLPGTVIPLRPGELLLCLSEVYPLRAGPIGSRCAESSPSGWPLGKGPELTARVMFREIFTRVSGLAADDVRKLDLVLPGGRVIPVALRDNTYTVEAPSAQFPAKLVAYDGRQRPIAVLVVPTPYRPVVTRCPAAATRPVPAPPAATPYTRLDPQTGSVNGHPILGRRLAEVEAALGRPDSASPARIEPRTQDLALYYGVTRGNPAALTVYLHRHGPRLRASQLVYRTPSLAVAGLGHVLRLQPTEFQRRMASAYGSSYRLDVAYGSEPARLGCTGSFKARGRPLEVVFGVDPTRSGRPFLILRQPY